MKKICEEMDEERATRVTRKGQNGTIWTHKNGKRTDESKEWQLHAQDELKVECGNNNQLN